MSIETFRNGFRRAALLGIVMVGLLSANVRADDFGREIEFHIAPQSLASAVLHFAEQAQIQVVTSSTELERLKSQGLSGRYNVREALTALLIGTGLTFQEVGNGTISIGKDTGAHKESDAAALPAYSRDGRLRVAQAESASAAPAAEGGLEEILVTAKRKFRPESSDAASRLELPLIETPQALTVLSSEFLNIARLNDTAGVVAYTPGVELAGIGDGTQANLMARGFDVNRERSFRVNGLSADSEIDLDYFAMDRVEIVRGPASSLYGEADYGATLNRVLKRPTGRSSATLSMELGSYDFRRLQADVQAPLGAGGAVSGRAVAAVQDSKTFIDATEDDRVLFSPSLSVDLGATRLLFQGYYEKLDGASSDGFPLILEGVDAQDQPIYSLPRQPRSRNYGADVFKIDSENMFVFAGVDHDVNDTLRLSLKSGYSQVDMDNVSGVMFAAQPDGSTGISPFAERKTKEDLSFDASAEKRFTLGGREQRVLLSADWRRNDVDNPRPVAFVGSPANIFIDGPLRDYPQPTPVVGEFARSKQNFYGLSTMAYLKPAERLSLLLGLRYSGIETDVRRFLFGGRVNATIDGAKDHDLVPRAALVFALADHHNAYLSYSEGIVFNQTLLKLDGSAVNPEKGVQYELGVKGELADRRVMYSAAAFRIDRTDSASRLARPPGEPPAYFNVGKQIHQGVELELIGEPIPGLNVVANYAYLDVDVKESADPLEVGQRPASSPVHSHSLFATYEILRGPLRSLTFGGGVVGRSAREVDSIGSYRLPSYERLDLRLSYNLSDALLLELNAQNVLNERIYTSQYGSADFGIAYGYARAFSGRLSYKW